MTRGERTSGYCLHPPPRGITQRTTIYFIYAFIVTQKSSSTLIILINRNKFVLSLSKSQVAYCDIMTGACHFVRYHRYQCHVVHVMCHVLFDIVSRGQPSGNVQVQAIISRRPSMHCHWELGSFAFQNPFL